MKKRLRGWFRLTRLSLATAVLYSLWLPGHVLLGATPRARGGWRRWILRKWSRAVCRALAVRIEVVGRPPRGGAFVVCNHLSYLDITVLGSCLDTVFVSKAEIADWPVIGLLSRHFGTIFLTRERKRALPDVNEQIQSAIAAGDGVVVFPEGTSTDGSDVLPFRAPLLAPAAVSGVAVWPATIAYATTAPDPPASTAVCWWGDMEFAPHVRAMLRLDAIEARVEFGSEPVSDADRKVLAEKLLQAVKSRFRPLT